ncbi:MAG: hypothetical protein CMG50_01495 [Candidatus Marinimicrobia bacterium]|nr:hypothetical protein [Candidatus Neomarinimicrobiota bacterium]
MMHYKELETMFADDFSSPVFPLLADYYLKDNQLNRALKVCKIGLANNPGNLYGEFILSQIFLQDKKFLEAEKKLKKIVNNSINIQALILLVDVLVKLNRSQATIQKYILILDKHIPNHKKVKLYKKEYLNGEHKIVAKVSKKSINKPALNIVISNKLATKTMFDLLLKQKKYYHALEVLNIMEPNKKNSQFIKKNKPELLNKIKKGMNNHVIY